MKTAVSNTTQQVLSTWQKKRGAFSAFSRSVLVILLCTAGLSGNAFAAPATAPLSTENAAPAVQPAAASPSAPVTTDAQAPASALALPASAAPGTNNLMKTDLSVWVCTSTPMPS